MPVKPLARNPDLDHLRYQAKDLLKAHAARSMWIYLTVSGSKTSRLRQVHV